MFGWLLTRAVPSTTQPEPTQKATVQPAEVIVQASPLPKRRRISFSTSGRPVASPMTSASKVALGTSAAKVALQWEEEAEVARQAAETRAIEAERRALAAEARAKEAEKKAAEMRVVAESAILALRRAAKKRKIERVD